MLQRRVILMVMVMMTVVGGLWIAQAMSGSGAPAEGGTRARRGEGDREQRMAEFRKRMADRMREQLGATEEEFTKVLQPRIEKIQQIQRRTRGGFPGGRGGRRGGRRGGGERQPAEGAPEREKTDVEKKTEALQSLLEDKASKADAVKAALDALRKARAKAEADLATARKELRAVVTVRQEAQLVLMRILD